jgi:cyclohexanone monooxygenase
MRPVAQAMDEDMVKTDPETVDAIIVGAGLAGLYTLYRLRERGLSARVFEAGSDVGGTWYWNRYPGARCDVESLQYSYSFSPELQQEWTWSERYGGQPEILRYIQHVAERFDLRRDIHFDTRVVSAIFDDETNLWTVKTDQEETITATFCIMATGCLSSPYEPDYPGLDDFQGNIYHTGRWPHEEVDFTGKRVGVIGTGATAIQLIPVVAEQASHLTVFQRTANYSIPGHNRPPDAEVVKEFKADYDNKREKARHTFAGMTGFPSPRASAVEDAPENRRQFFEERWADGGGTFSMLTTYRDLLVKQESNDLLVDFVHEKIRTVVRDPDVAELLTPKNQPIGAKRLPVDTYYFETYNRENVSLVDIRSAPIERISPTGLRTADAAFEFDDLILATGFDAMTGALLAMDIRRKDGPALQDIWAEGPDNYLGVMVAGLPNLFMITGPGSPSVKMNMILAIEQHTDWIVDCIDHLRANDLYRIEPMQQAQDDWVVHVREVAEATLMPEADSWYVGANIPGKPRVFMPYFAGFERYWKICDEVVADGYRGFELTDAPGTDPTTSKQETDIAAAG